MNEHKKAFENAERAARTARTLAVKTAKAALNAAIKAAYAAPCRQPARRQYSCERKVPCAILAPAASNPVERAWNDYDAKLDAIWEAYGTAVQNAMRAYEKAYAGEVVPQEQPAQASVPQRSIRPVPATITTSIFHAPVSFPASGRKLQAI
jgi:hypothetical protein